MSQTLITNLTEIATIAAARENENDGFRLFLNQQDGEVIDGMVRAIDADISPRIDCTKCGNCCRSLMINITEKETENLAKQLGESIAVTKEKYIETSSEGQLIINAIPCHFLQDNACTIYEHRFNECRAFPHLHKPNFTGRIFGTLMYYSICPIIFNVVEKLKEKAGFKTL